MSAFSGLNTKHVKASSSTGKTGTIKRDGYAAGPVPSGQVGTKNGKPYSGPNKVDAGR